ncbi:hypothetical protein SNE40_006231 [Patella caerulea]|uniref:HEPN domain-containing protein n=1 Tax=Patella caerulea TaxID=87958 RepID=A0AAN8JWD6_PATCE
MEEESSDEEYSAMRLPSLIDQLKRLLEQYTDGQILKELIQNAEDGGASMIKVMYVNKHHQPPTTSKMWKENPIQFAMKGPALCVFNDGIFTKKDWKGIAAIQCSQKENEPLKVGRFGLGFKSVFHITDTPLILSGNKLMIINPAANVHDVVLTKKLKVIDAEDQNEMLDLMSGIFGFSPEIFQDGFNGTIFWFPLRTVESSLCKTIYDERKIRDIFHDFTSLAPSVLLFLKEIEKIEIYERHAETRKLFEVCLDGDDLLKSRQERKRFVQEIERFNGRFASQPIKNVLRLIVRCEGFDWMKMETSEDEWLVFNQYHGGNVSAELMKLVEEDDWPYSPYVSIAACLSKPITKGHVFCFLPLPLEGQSLTGLPVHVNGFFALSQDRHHVRWNSSEQDRNDSHTEKSILWNQYLVKEILPQVYTNLIKQLLDDEKIRSQSLTSSERSQRADVVYRILPNHENVTDNWKLITDPIFQQLYSTACMFTKREEGIWVEPQNTIFTELQDKTIVDSLEHAYLLCGKNFSRAPICIINAFGNHGPIPFISAEHLREELLQHPKVCSQLELKDKLNLLRYILDSDVSCLQGLKLLPLADGNFCTFTTGTPETVYIFEDVDDMKMFPGLEFHFVKSELEPDLYLKIQNQCSAEIGTYQIKTFQPDDFSNLIDLCIKQNKWQGIKLTKFLEEWLSLVWTYIGKYRNVIIEKIRNLDLLPYTDPETFEDRLTKTANIAILESYTGSDVLHEPLIGALEKLNIKVYKALPEYISTVVVGNFVEYPTPEGMVNCLRKVTENNELMGRSVKDFNSRSSSSEKKALLVKINAIENISNIKKLLRKLHLFSLTPGADMDVCLDDVKEIFDGSNELQIPIKPHEKMIQCSDKFSESLHVAIKLEGKQKSFSEIISKILQDLRSDSSYSMNEKLKFMDFFVENMKTFEDDEPKMKLARNIQFIENVTGQYCCPSELFDPKPKLLHDLFQYRKSVFPSTRYNDNLKHLKKLGLRRVCDIEDNEILETANFINEQYLNNGQSDLSKISRALVDYLNTDGNRLKDDTIQLLSSLTWCPVLDNRPDNYPEKLEFAADDNTNLLKKPCELTHYDYVDLVGGKQFIARKDMPACLTKFLMDISKMTDSVIDQLLFVSKDYSETSVTEQSKFMTVLEHIYGFLTEHKIFTGMSQKRVVWTGPEGKFQSPEDVWLTKHQSDIPLQPFMFSVPDTFYDFKDLFLGIGCKSEQSNEVLLKTLHQIKDKHDNLNQTHPQEVVTKDLSLVLQIVNTLASSEEDVSQEILLPIFTKSDDVLQLKPAQECTVCNRDWLSDLVSTSTAAETEPIYFIHRRISRDTAEVFKVPVLTDRVLRNAEQFDMNYGQTEPLTTRLHNLLKDYTDGFTIPKEIIQNADDAGATTVKLLYDERIVKEAQTCLFNEGMIPCQGPAFWAYNDATFTDDDFRNITRLAGATKKDDRMKIGRFGLGFNSVYNLTDVPSFLSGETYVVFDPHTSHLGTSGLKINLNFPGNQLLRHKMKGQFYPFEGVFGCNIVDKDKVHFDGTLFRLPLRNSDEASKSAIKDISYSKSEMKEFVKKIEEGAGNLLLFTQHVNKIELYHLDKDSSSGKPELLMKVSKSSDHSEQPVLQTLTEARNDDAHCTEIIKITLSITRRSKSLYGIEELDVTVPYIINWSFGQGSSIQEAKRNEFKGLLPVAATALTKVPLQNIPNFYKESHLFCFLPLPIESKLPVHINASFAVQSSRRDLMWRNEDDKESECVEDRWNTAVLEDAGSQAYIRMLTTMAAMSPEEYYRLWPSLFSQPKQPTTVAARLSLEKYYRLWPSVFSQPKHDKILTREVYNTICKGDCAVFPSKNGAVSLKKSVFLCSELKTSKDVGKIAFKALRHFVIDEKQKLSDFAADVTIVDLPADLLYNFKQAGCENQINERIITVEVFYKEIVFPNLKNDFWLKEELDEIILHGILGGNKVILDLIAQNKCIPTKPNGERKSPDELIHPNRELANLFSVEEECFPEDSKFITYTVLKVLGSLGMKTDELEWEHLPKRIRSVLHPGPSELLINRTEKFLRYMTSTCGAEERYQKCPDDIRKELSNLEFLALQKPPCNWTLPWYGGDNTEWPFTSPLHGYLPDCRHLVGCIKPVVDISKYTYYSKITDVLKWLGVRHLGSKIDLKLVIENLLIISNHTMESGPMSDGYIILDTAFRDIYNNLRKVVEENNEEDIQYIKQSLENKAVILHERTLKTADKMVMELRNNLSPYLFPVDPRYKRYKDLFVILGVRVELTLSMLIEALLLFSEEKGSTKLSSDEIDCVNRLCNECERLCDQQTVDKRVFESIKLPDESSELTFTKDLYFDDSAWLSNDLEQTHLHKKISRSVAELMGVKSKRSHDIENLSSPLFSEFGQHEDLTNRIKGILEDYPYDESILKEMLQNADDAGATEVIFIKDFRQLKTNSLPDDKLGQIQGPALCIYNNTCFSERDLKGIQALGLGSKRDEVLKTGQYGVGFNVVYNVTDVPSFWSKGGEIGELICICDPHCKYLQSATGRRPGSKMKVSGLRGRYTDFMEGYLPKFTNKLDKGTLFRLPLRTKEMSATSEIRNEETTTQDIEDIIKKLKVQIFPCMLFLENITKIKIASVNRKGDLNIEHKVSSKMSKKDTKKQKKYNNYLRELSDKMGELQPNTLKAPFEIQITLNLRETKSSKHEQFAIVKRVGFLPEYEFPEKLNRAYDKGIVQKLPRGGVAINLAGKVNGNAYCTLPLPILTGLPVHINGQFALDHESRRNLRCVKDSIEGQWNEHLAKYVIVPAYISALDYLKDYLLKYRQYWKPNKLIRKFEARFPLIKNATDVFWRAVTEESYLRMAKKDCQMFPVVTDTSRITWVNLQIGDDGDFAGCFNRLKYYLKETGTPSQSTCYRSAGISHHHSVGILENKPANSYELKEILVRLGMKILISSEIILEQLQKSGAKVQSSTPENVLRFLKSFSRNELLNRCEMGNLPCGISNTPFRKTGALRLVLEFVMKGINNDNVNNLYGAPLLLKQDNTVDVFSANSTVIVSKYYDLLPEHSSTFLSSELIHLMYTFTDSLKALVKWNLPGFSKLAKKSSKEGICLNRIVPWNGNTPVSEEWLNEAWKFISDDVPVDLTREELILKLNPIVKFSLLPVKRGQETLLYPLSHAGHVLDTIYGGAISSNQKTIKVLTELGIPTLKITSQFIQCRLAVQIDNPSGILELMIKNMNYLSSISAKQAECLWRYFSTNVEDINTQNMKVLPIFQAYDDHMISLDRNRTYVCLGDSCRTVPTEGLHHWSDVSNIELLRYNHDLRTLYKRMKVEIIEPGLLYIKYILRNFHCFRHENQDIHLKYIRDHLFTNLSPIDKDALISELKNVRFVSYKGDMWTASKFYDKENEVFKVMGDHVDFPPSPFDQDDWRDFMIEAGLIDEVSSQMFVTFAEIIEHAGVNATTIEQSHTLFGHFIAREDASDEEFCKRIKNIKFLDGFHLTSEDFRSQIHHQHGCRKNFICFNGSFKNGNTNLVWTEANILHILPPDFTHSDSFLGIKTKINRNSFINHLTRICGSLADGNRLKGMDSETIIDLFKELYQYIDANGEVKSMPELRTLNLIFLPNEGIMVNAASLLIESHTDETIKGHIYKVPYQFSEFCTLFEELGAWSSAVTDLYLSVLRVIYTQCRDSELEPNESIVVKKCMEQLIRLWDKKAESESSMTEDGLFLPNRNGILTKSTELVLIDNASLYQRVENLTLPYFIGFEEMDIVDADQWRIHNNCPKKYQMQSLRKVVKETIVPEFLENAVQNTTFTNQVSDMLKDEHLLKGVVRLVRHNTDKYRKTIDDKTNSLLDEAIQTVVNIEIFEVANLMTQLIYQDQAVPGSEEPCTIFFVKQHRSEQLASYSLYVDKAGPKDGLIEYHRTLSKLFRQIFDIDIGGHFRDIWERVVRGNSGAIQSYLDKQKINCSNPGFNLRYTLFPPVGTNIPEKLHWLLDNSFCDFDKGEYVGYEVYDPLVEDISDDGITVDAPYYTCIYAKIVEKIQAETDTEFAVYSINVGKGEPIQTSVTRLYKFHRNNTSTSRELVLSGTGEAESQIEGNNDNLDIKTILRDIRQNLERAWKYSDESERRRVLKRLLLKWHPDKNRHNVVQSTEITQHILNYVERLKRGLSLDDESVSDDEAGSARRSQHNRSYERFYSNVNSRARNKARHCEDQRSNTRYNNDNSFHRSARDEPKPSPGQAEQWLKQADCDLKAAEQSLSSGASEHNWICYKCQQSAEKALKAVWYTIDAKKVNQAHDLNRVASGLPYPDLVQLAEELQSTIGEYTGMRYPDAVSYPRIPHDAYNRTDSNQACTLARQIMTKTNTII